MSEAIELYPRDIVDSPRPPYEPVLVSALGNLENYLQEARTNPNQRVLYEEQVPVMEDLYANLREHGMDLRGRIVVPTGVGKTVLFTEFVKATGLRTLILTPTKLLLQQTEAAFEKFTSDDEISIGKVYSGEKNGDEKITITTYASFVRHTKNKDSPYINPSNYDLIILDEAHRALAEGAQAALKEYPNAVHIGFTATDKFSEKRQLGNVLPHEIHRMSIKEAVDSGLISPFSVWVVETDTDMSSVRVKSTNEYDQEDLQAALNTEARNQVAAELYVRHFADQKAIFACSGVEHAKTMAALLENIGVPAAAIHGGLTLNQQREIKTRFADADPSTGLMVLCNDKILSEGFDEPQVGACFNLAPTLSYVRSQQRSGRALRTNPNDPNKHAIIVEFVDKNYQKPPVLFADVNVAGTAHLGVDLDHDIFSQTFDFNLASASLITDPSKISELTTTFAERRSNAKPNAPEGWLTLSGLAASLNSSSGTISSKLRLIREHIPELYEEDTGQFVSPGVKGGVTTYYSPRFRKNLEVLISPPDIAPPEWLTVNQIAARYEISSAVLHNKLDSMSSHHQGYSGIFVMENAGAGKKKFFSPECIQAVVEQQGKQYLGNNAPPEWKNRNELNMLFTDEAIEFATAMLEAVSKATIYIHTMQSDEIQYFSPQIVEKIKRVLTPPRGWRTIQNLALDLGLTITEAEECIRSVRGDKQLVVGSDYRLGVVDDKIEYYYPAHYAIRIELVLKDLARNGFSSGDGVQPPQQQVDLLETETTETPQEFTENQVILIPRFTPAKAPHIARKDMFDDIEFEDIVSPRTAQKKVNSGAKRNQHEVVTSNPEGQSQDSSSRQESGVNSTQRTDPVPIKPAQNANHGYLGALKRFKR